MRGFIRNIHPASRSSLPHRAPPPSHQAWSTPKTLTSHNNTITHLGPGTIRAGPLLGPRQGRLKHGWQRQQWGGLWVAHMLRVGLHPDQRRWMGTMTPALHRREPHPLVGPDRSGARWARNGVFNGQSSVARASRVALGPTAQRPGKRLELRAALRRVWRSCRVLPLHL